MHNTIFSSSLSVDGRQQIMARTLLRPDLPPDHGFLQLVYPAQFTRSGVPHPDAGDAAVAGRAARGNVMYAHAQKGSTHCFNSATATL